MTDYTIISTEAFDALITRLRRDAAIFHGYAKLHSDKKSAEGTRKAAANRAHAEEIEAVIGNFSGRRKYRPFTEQVDHAIEHGYNCGHNPVAIVVSYSFLQAWTIELRSASIIPFETLTADMIGSTWCGLTIYAAEDRNVSGVVAVGEGSKVLDNARIAYNFG